VSLVGESIMGRVKRWVIDWDVQDPDRDPMSFASLQAADAEIDSRAAEHGGDYARPRIIEVDFGGLGGRGELS
jgi:hypothetical protein